MMLSIILHSYPIVILARHMAHLPLYSSHYQSVTHKKKNYHNFEHPFLFLQLINCMQRECNHQIVSHYPEFLETFPPYSFPRHCFILDSLSLSSFLIWDTFSLPSFCWSRVLTVIFFVKGCSHYHFLCQRVKRCPDQSAQKMTLIEGKANILYTPSHL